MMAEADRSLSLSRAGCRGVGATVPFPQGIRKESDLTAMVQRFLSDDWRGRVGGVLCSTYYSATSVAIIFIKILFRLH
jgi:hypothetical protein